MQEVFIIKKFIGIFLILIFVVYSYFLLKDHYENHKFDMNKIPTRRTRDYGSTLCLAFAQRNWSRLYLSENFRKKYKNKFDITKYAGRFVSYDAGSTTENGEKLIIIYYLKVSLLDFDDSDSIRYSLYFRYTATDDGLLDDVEFVRMEKCDPMTGKIKDVVYS